MYSKNGSATVGARRFAITITMTVALTAASAGAETIATINGANIDSSVLEVYVQSRTQRPLREVSAQEREGLVSELKDLFILSTQPSSADLRKDPEIAAQLELRERAILAQAFAAKFLTDNAATEEEIQAEYETQAKLAPPMQFKARHILVPTQSEAIALIDRLHTGSDFATLAMENSTGPSANDGGALPWFSPDQMVRPFSDAVAALEDGKYTSEPIQTEFGWHVILREESRTNEAPPLESVRDTIAQNVAQKKFQDHLEKLRADAASKN